MADSSRSARLLGCRGATLLIALALLAAALASATIAAHAAYAAGGQDIGSITAGNRTRTYSNYEQLKSELIAHGDEEVTVEMLGDWNVPVNEGNRLVIPPNSRVTLNMNGHMLNRQLTNDGQAGARSGEAITVLAGAVLTINGGSKDIAHEAHVYNALNAGRTAQPAATETIRGGLITGGYSSASGGGINVTGVGSTIILNDVTIAGCRAARGGGVHLNREAVLDMNNSTITGCYADRCGGGVNVGGPGAEVDLVDASHVDGNFANDSGGGIMLDTQLAKVSGGGAESATSTVSNNRSAHRAGGIYVSGDSNEIDWLALEGNQCGVQGGALYIHNDNTTLTNLSIKNNKVASSTGENEAKGGGIFITAPLVSSGSYAGDTLVRDCVIEGNTAKTGGGVYIDDTVDAPNNGERRRVISGQTVVKGNASDPGNAASNLCIESVGWERKRESFNLIEDAEVHVSIINATSGAKPSNIVDDTVCAKYLHSDLADPGNNTFYFDVGRRFINWGPKSAAEVQPTPRAPADVNDAANRTGSIAENEKAGKVGEVYAGGADTGSGDKYNKIRGFYLHERDGDLSVFYYSDALFYASPFTYNEHLATLSLAFAFAGGYLNKSEAADASGNTYYNKHAAARQFLADIGCPDQNIYVNDYMIAKPTTDSIGVSIGSKELAKADGTKTGDILVAAAVRGFGYEAEWVSNVTLDSAEQMAGRGKEAKGFSDAAEKVTAEIEYYLKKYNLEDEYRAGKVKFWVTGYSRAGATANLTSKRLVDKIAKDQCGSQVFGYPCEAPKGGTDDAEVAGNNYTCIHNLINTSDIVPYVAPGEMGFKRYGVDHYIPGTQAGEVKSTKKNIIRGGKDGPTTATTMADNQVTWTKTSDYNTQKAKMLKQLKAMDHTMTFDDYFHPMSLDYLHYSFPFSIEKFKLYKNGNYEGNHVEDFVADFVRFLQEGSSSGDRSHWSQAINSRDRYAIEKVKINGSHPPLQSAARDVMSILYGVGGTTEKDLDLFKSRAQKITDYIPKIGTRKSIGMDDIYLYVIRGWHDRNDYKKNRYITQLKNKFTKTGALDALSAADKKRVTRNFATLLDFVFRFLEADRDRHPVHNTSLQWAKGSNETVMYMATFIQHKDFIIACHFPQVNIAWARSYDSWYTGEEAEYKLIAAIDYSVDAPTAFGMENGESKALEPGADKENRLPGDQKVLLENAGIAGEAVYYDLADVTSGTEKLGEHQLYRGGIDLQLGDEVRKSYEITAYSMSYGKKSSPVTYRVTLFNPRHTVVVLDAVEADADASAGGSGGSPVTGQGLDAGVSPLGLVAGSSVALRPNSTGTIVPRSREFSFTEGQEVLVNANVPSSQYFKNWAVRVTDNKGDPVGDDVAQTLLGDQRTNSSATFTMPQAGDETYPYGYRLRLDADYGEYVNEVRAVNVEGLAPRAGRYLNSLLDVEFGNGKKSSYRVNWTYSNDSPGDGREVLAPDNPDDASQGSPETESDSDIAYGDTVYTATVHIRKDQASDIVFAPSVSVSSDWGTVKSATVQRDAEDGGITIAVEFPATEHDDAHVRPSDLVQFTVETLDMNTGQPDSDVPSVKYWAHKNTTVSLKAPDVPGERFVEWDLGSSEIAYDYGSGSADEAIWVKIPENLPEGATVTAKYKPVVQKAEVNLYDQDGNLFAPAGDGTGPSSWKMLVTIKNDYEVHPDDLQVSWSPGLPEGGTYAYLTNYTGTVKIVPDEQGKVRVKRAGADDSQYQAVSLQVLPADSVDVKFNGDAQDVSYKFADHAASKVFPKTTYVLGAVKDPDDIQGVAYADGDDQGEIRELLPATTKIVTTSGFELDADVEWDSVLQMWEPEPYEEMVWLASGTVTLPDTVRNPGDAVSLDVFVFVFVDAAESALPPAASLDPGTYLYNQVTTLSTNEEHATIYYTTDGTDPTTSKTKREYHGEEIHINRADATQDEMDYDDSGTATPTGRKAFVIKAYADVHKKRPSDVVELEYVFGDIPAPDGVQLDYMTDEEHPGGIEQIALHASPFYKLEIVNESGELVNGGKGKDDGTARLDDEGNVLVTNEGMYWARATLYDSYNWEAYEDGTKPANPYVVSVSVNSNFNIVTTQSYPFYGGTTAGDGKYFGDETVTVSAAPEKGYTFVGWTEDNRVVSTQEDYTFDVHGDHSLTANFDWILNVRWLDGNGTELLHRDVGMIREVDIAAFDYDGPVPTKAADAQYSYTFSGWDGGQLDDEWKTLTYTAQFDSSLNKYKVAFVDDDGTVLKGTVEYDYGTPAAEVELPAEPTKAADAQYAYTFKGWSPAVADVTADVTYIATYDKTPVQPGAGDASGRENAETAPFLPDDAYGKATYAPLKLRSGKTTKSSIKLVWSKVAGAQKYVVFGNRNGKRVALKNLGASAGNTFTVKSIDRKLAKGAPYKFVVQAIDGNGAVISTSKFICAFTKGGKFGNPKSVIVKKSVLAKAKKLKKGKTLKLNAKMRKAGKKGIKKIVGIRYESTNTAVAKVSKRGKVKAVGKGRCYVYAYAQNGVAKRVKVIVR